MNAGKLMPRMTSRAPRTVAAAAAAAAAITGLVLAGCSSGSTSTPGRTTASVPSAASLISSMKSAFATASSVRMTGTLHQQGKTVTLNLGMLRNGDMSGMLNVGSTRFTLIVTGGKAYALVTKEFFKTIQQNSHVPDSVCNLMCGKYIAVPVGTFTSFSLPGMTKQIEKKIPVPSSVHATVTTYRGQPAYELSGDGTRLFLARNGVHYLLGMVAPANFGVLNFSDWNAVPPVKAPPASQVYTVG